MRKIKDVLRLKLDARLSHERIAASLGLSKGVVTKYVTLAAAAQLDWPTIQGLDEADLQRRLLPTPVKHSDVALPDYGYVHQELRRKGMTLMLLWEEHVAQRPEQRTHKYSQFCEHYRQYGYLPLFALWSFSIACSISWIASALAPLQFVPGEPPHSLASLIAS